MEPANYYRQLGIARNATESEIRGAYRRLARELHPDALPPDTPARVRDMAEVEFARLQEAYDVLSDPVSRTTYDDVQNNWATLNAIDRRPVDRSRRSWVVPLASGVIGAAIAITGVALANGIAANRTIEFKASDSSDTAEPANSSEANVAGTQLSNSPAADNAASQRDAAASSPAASTAQPLAEGFASEAESFSRGELTRFAATAIAIKPLLERVETRLQAAQTTEERQDIEREFDLEATQIIESNGLSAETYQAIARVAQSDDSVRKAVTAAAERLQGG